MSWRLARALETLRAQVNAKWPNRSKSSDGSIGDTAHSARVSDHNPDSAGVVHAIDITHDPAHGFDSYAFADHLLAEQDPRLRYVISNSRIGSGPAGPAPGKWRRYTGLNPHNHHIHISVVTGPSQDSTAPWNIDGVPAATAAAAKTYDAPPATIRRGDKGDLVKRMQEALTKTGMATVAVDGDFGPKTETALKDWQRSRKIAVDGICGAQTWALLLESAE